MRKQRQLWVVVLMVALVVAVAGCSGRKKIEKLEEMRAPEAQSVPGESAPGAFGPEDRGEAVHQDQTLEAGIRSFEESPIYFDFDRASLTREAREMLARKAAFLKANVRLKVLIEGHCDERATVEYNLALGERRARAAAEYLRHLGVDRSRLDTVSYGKERPLDPGHTEEAWAKNRRAQFVIVKE